MNTLRVFATSKKLKAWRDRHGQGPNEKFVVIGNAVMGYGADVIMIDDVSEVRPPELVDQWVEQLQCRLLPGGKIFLERPNESGCQPT